MAVAYDPRKDFKVIGDTVDRGIAVVIYADPGTGKTTCIKRLPVGETLIINVECGRGALLGSGHTVFEMDRDLDKIAGLYRFLLTEKHPFKYVVIDNISELQEWFVLAIVKMKKKDFATLVDKGEAASKLREYTYNFRNLIEVGINVVFNAWEMPFTIEKSADGDKTRTVPKVFPSLATELCGIVDMVGHLEKYEKTEDRYIRFEPTPTILAKSQYRGVDKFEPADLCFIFDKVRKFSYQKAKPFKPLSSGELQLIKGDTVNDV